MRGSANERCDVSGRVLAVSAGSVVMQCDSGCEDADESSGKWEVFGGPTGPFRMDSRVCKAALIAGVIDGDGGEVSLSGI